VWHRGAVDADGKTGDGAGIHVDLPVRFFDDAIAASGHKPLPNRLAVGMVFLPRTDLGAQEALPHHRRGRDHEAGYTIYGWRQVPVDVSVIGEKAQRTRPEIEQIMIAGPMPEAQDMAEFEKELYLIRRRIEKKVVAAQINDFYICSLSCRSIIYKGMFLAEQPVGLLSRPEGRPLRESGSRSSTSAIRPTPSRNGGWRSRSARSRTTARSTRMGQQELDEKPRIKMASLAFGEQSRI
jgi:glutamate synthase (NADPH/NADH) large chain